LKKSTDTRSVTWFSRKERHVGDGGFSRRGIHRDTVRCEIVIPSLSSSACTRGAPQSGFAVAILSTSSFVLPSIPGRPRPRRRDLQVQYLLKPPRCQRMTVSG
jgi:hypothetical protein